MNSKQLIVMEREIMGQSIHLRHLCFTNSKNELAEIEFSLGLNLLYGASETGKSFVLEAIAYMLGGKKLRNIPESIGYNNVFLGIESSSGEVFTLQRSAGGGNYYLYGGLHKGIPDGINPEVIYHMDAKNVPTGKRKISEFILSKVGLDKKKLKKNEMFETVNLNLSHVLNLCVIDDTAIARKSSVIDRNDNILNTQDHSLFRLILTGSDDSSLVPSISNKDRKLSKNSKLEVINALIENNNRRVSSAEMSYEDAKDQIEKIQKTIDREEKVLAATEIEYKNFITERTFLRKEQSLRLERRHEIDGLIQRFRLLEEHYSSDLERLDSLCEAGTFMHLLDNSLCPYCGALPEMQNSNACPENISSTVEAAVAEKKKILKLKYELSKTIDDISLEARYVENIIPEIESKLTSIDIKLADISPLIKENTETFSVLIERRSLLKEIIAAYEQISDLTDMKKEIECEAKTKRNVNQPKETSLPKTLLDALAKQIELMLKDWEFPEFERVFFDTETNDLIIDGKYRNDRGRGRRSIIHAAFNIGLLEFCKKNNLPHLGFIVLDSPLLAYRDPDDDQDSLKGTSVQDNFYKYLLKIQDRQVIIIENVEPPSFVRQQPYVTHFSGNPAIGRCGFFPVADRIK